MAQEARSKDRKDGKQRQSPKDFFKDLLFVLVSFFFLNSFVLASFEVPTGSMENEIMAGDFLFVNKFIYGGTTPRTIPFTNIRLPWFRLPAFRHVERGDVIVFEFTGYRDDVVPEEFQYYLKRAIGLARDTVKVVNRVVYVNGQPAPLPRHMKFNSYHMQPPGYADPRIFPVGSPYNEDNWGPVVIPWKGEVIQLSAANFEQWKTFILREGHTPRMDEAGRVIIDGNATTEYRVERSYLFGMGDNRDNSLDGRFWGFIPEQNLVGTPMIVYWSWDPDMSIFNIFGKLASVRLSRVGTIIR